MSSVADVLGWTDLLSNHSLKPWWETVRSVTLVVMTLISSLLFISLSDSPISCFPDESNITYSAAQAKFVEKICGQQTFNLMHSLLWISVFTTGLTFVAHNYWLYQPTVGAAIIRFSTAYVIHNDLRVMFPSMKVAITTPNYLDTPESAKERRNKVRQLCTNLMWFMKNGQQTMNPQKCSSWCCRCPCHGQASNTSDGIPLQSVRNNSPDEIVTKIITTAFAKSYGWRNFISFSLAFAYIVVSVVAMILWFPRQNVFPCDRSEIEYNCTCASNGVIINFVATGIFAGSSFVQWVIFIALLIKYLGKDDLELLKSLAEESSEKETWDTFSEWIKKLQTSNLKRTAIGNFANALEAQDIDFFYFVSKTLGVNVAGELRKGNYNSKDYENNYIDLKDIFGATIPEPDYDPVTSYCYLCGMTT